MYALAYVILPHRYTSLQRALDETLAPFKRGTDGDFPREKLAFDDETDDLICLHKSRFEYRSGAWHWDQTSAASSFNLDVGEVKKHLGACKLDEFEGTFEELEPDFDRFVRLFCRASPRDPDTGRYGRWLNPLGMWDWWELGGRFNGAITGDPRPGSDHQFISSGADAGRSIIGNLAHALGAEPASEASEIELNVELVAALAATLGAPSATPAPADRRSRSGSLGEAFLRDNVDEDRRGLPFAVVLPVDAGPDAGRWFDNLHWHKIHPDVRTVLNANEDDDYRTLVQRAYARFSDRAAAGIAYHF